jgi:hypothetical protein
MKPYPQFRRRVNLCASSQPQHVRTSGRASASSLLLLALFLALAPTALASNTWYVDGAHGKNKNDCKCNGHLLKTDQRGFPRPDKEDTGGCDMGAYERQKD